MLLLFLFYFILHSKYIAVFGNFLYFKILLKSKEPLFGRGLLETPITCSSPWGKVVRLKSQFCYPKSGYAFTCFWSFLLPGEADSTFPATLCFELTSLVFWGTQFIRSGHNWMLLSFGSCWPELLFPFYLPIKDSSVYGFT